MVLNFIRGFCMALADSVPGVSGGTIAFLLGFYDKFIGSLNSLISGTKEERIDGIKFLIKIGIGWVVGFCMAILFITSVFDSHIYEISSLFIGFILFALPIIIIEEKDTIKGRYLSMIYVVFGALLVCGITYLSGSTMNDGINLVAGKFSVVTGVLLILSGVVAISAMVLPGISGSTVLMIFGLYIPITNAVKDVLHLELEYVPALLLFGIGVISGALLVVKFIRKALESFRPQTIYFILGMMLGSVYSIINGATTLDEPKEALSLSTFSIVFFIIGGIIIIGLQLLKLVVSKED